MVSDDEVFFQELMISIGRLGRDDEAVEVTIKTRANTSEGVSVDLKH